MMEGWVALGCGLRSDIGSRTYVEAIIFATETIEE